MASLMDLTLRELSAGIRSREVSPVDLLDDCLRRLEAAEGRLNAYITVLADRARAEAREAEQEIARGFWRGPLHGIPYSAKDLFETAGVRTTAGSRVLADHVPDQDATVVARLRAAGAILVGKTNLHEFAAGGTSENEAFGAVRNPWDPTRIPGGSSGGSAASVAAGSSTFSLGTDTGGSIRGPAAHCACVGLKPTYGRVSRAGVVTLSWSLDHAGPIARTVWDAAAVLQAIAGPDPRDPGSAAQPTDDWVAAVEGAPRTLAGLRVGWCRSWYFEGLDPEVEAAVLAALRQMAELGAEVDEVAVPHVPEAAQVHTLINLSESSCYHRRWLAERPEAYSPGIRTRFEASRDIPAEAYLRVQRWRQWYRQTVWTPLLRERIDLLAAPTTALQAFPVGATRISVGGREISPRDPSVSGRTSLGNFLGYPAVSVPCGFTADGLPVGLQLMARPFEEALLLRAAAAYEAATEWHQRRPPEDQPAPPPVDLAGLSRTPPDVPRMLRVLDEMSGDLPQEIEPAFGPPPALAF